jgi:hypothetical protein
MHLAHAQHGGCGQALTRLVPRLPSPTNCVGEGINGTGCRVHRTVRREGRPPSARSGSHLPPKKTGGGWVWGRVSCASVGSEQAPPGRHHRPTSPETAGGGWTRAQASEAGSKSTSPRVFWGRCEPRRVRGRPCGRSSISFGARSNSPLSVRNERGGAGGGAPRRRAQFDASRRACRPAATSTSPRVFWGRWAGGAGPEGARPSRRRIRSGWNPPHALTHSRTHALNQARCAAAPPATPSPRCRWARASRREGKASRRSPPWARWASPSA